MSAPGVGEALPALLYQGCANAWECDEMGHLNVRFHVARAVQGLAALSAEMGMAQAFGAAANATIAPLDIHVRFLREARPGAPLKMRGGLLDTAETEASAYLELRHADGAPSSTFRVRLAHIEPRTRRAFPWSSASRRAFPGLACALPAHGAPRSIDLDHSPSDVDMARADALALPIIGRSIVQPHECDAFGLAHADAFITRVSDAVPWLLADWRVEGAQMAAAKDGVQRAPGGAAVEFRVLIKSWPRAGDHVLVRSAIAEVMEKANRIVHWLIDPVSGAPWARVEAIAISFDLITRKAYAPSPEMRAALAKRAIGALLR